MIVAADQHNDEIECTASAAIEVETLSRDAMANVQDVKKDGLK